MQVFYTFQRHSSPSSKICKPGDIQLTAFYDLKSSARLATHMVLLVLHLHVRCSVKMDERKSCDDKVDCWICLWLLVVPCKH